MLLIILRSWNVRVIPRRLILNGRRPVSNRPSNSITPESDRRKPEITSTSVVLPAPFGPTIAVMPPAENSHVNSFSTCMLKNDLETELQRSTRISVGVLCARTLEGYFRSQHDRQNQHEPR